MSVLGAKLKKAASEVEQRSVTVKIGDEDVTLYSTPMRGVDFDWLQRTHKNFDKNPTVAGMADLIIRKCRTEDGEPAFGKEDRTTLCTMPLSWLGKVREALFEDDNDLSPEAIEDEEKN